ncbi:hypothetical protein VULLAG_LOCUS23174 [Vulpes lagopus]
MRDLEAGPGLQDTDRTGTSPGLQCGGDRSEVSGPGGCSLQGRWLVGGPEPHTPPPHQASLGTKGGRRLARMLPTPGRPRPQEPALEDSPPECQAPERPASAPPGGASSAL